MALPVVPLVVSDLSRQSVPNSRQSNWKAICTTPTTVDSSASILKPSAISRSGQGWGGCALVTSVQVCARYATGSVPSTDPIIQLIGIDGNGVPQNLSDSTGTTFSWTLTHNASIDEQDAAGFSYTAYVEVDAQANTQIIAAIATAMVGGGTGAAIMMRAK
jgi:hypothetical protein